MAAAAEVRDVNAQTVPTRCGPRRPSTGSGPESWTCSAGQRRQRCRTSMRRPASTRCGPRRPSAGSCLTSLTRCAGQGRPSAAFRSADRLQHAVGHGVIRQGHARRLGHAELGSDGQGAGFRRADRLRHAVRQGVRRQVRARRRGDAVLGSGGEGAGLLRADRHTRKTVPTRRGTWPRPTGSCPRSSTRCAG